MRIVVALDGSPFGERAIAGVTNKFGSLASDIFLLHVLPPHDVESGRQSGGAISPSSLRAGGDSVTGFAFVTPPLADEPRHPEDRTQLLNRLQAQWGEYLRELGQRSFPQALVTPMVHVARETAEAILKAADEVRADLIAMSTHGRSGVSHLVLGSVAERVVRKAQVPVLIMGPQFPVGKGQTEDSPHRDS